MLGRTYLHFLSIHCLKFKWAPCIFICKIWQPYSHAILKGMDLSCRLWRSICGFQSLGCQDQICLCLCLLSVARVNDRSMRQHSCAALPRQKGKDRLCHTDINQKICHFRSGQLSIWSKNPSPSSTKQCSVKKNGIHLKPGDLSTFTEALDLWENHLTSIHTGSYIQVSILFSNMRDISPKSLIH